MLGISLKRDNEGGGLMSRGKQIAMFVVFSMLLVLGQTSSAQSPETVILGEEYRLVPDDTIQVVIEGHEELTRDYRVPSDGEISLPPIGRLRLIGKSTEELEKEIAARFREKGQLTDPVVFVLILIHAPRKAFLIGAVTSQIDLPIHTKYGILEVLSMAGASPSVADLSSVSIMRKRPDGNTFRFEVDVEDVLMGGDFRKNIVIMPNDVIYVPAFKDMNQQAHVYVLGRVNNPGRYPFNPAREQLTLTKLVALAGDFHQYAKQSAVRILRKEGNRTRAIVIDFEEIIDLEEQDLVLQPDDLVYVPEAIF
jgi:polysaccharide biosynthesis/export protein